MAFESAYAYCDPLTNLPNRRSFVERLQYAIQIAKRQKGKIVVLFLDLDRFKPINDQYGHATGDQFLCEVASRLKMAVRESDTVSRFGGDEFVISLLNVASKEQAVILAKKILLNLTETNVEINSHRFEIKASIGGALYPDDADDAEKLIQYADHAMYQVKGQVGHDVAFHDLP
ncbi:MAG: GGDEF domain-containing protein [Gammaproteobacteria bacterium]|nr:GGDEF domain-containing protein [Gammaproteobacteria bacterium]